MPNRILKDSICSSDTIDQLSPEEEVFWYRLIVQCDDYGRMDARPAVLRARCFPLRLDKVTTEHVDYWLQVLAEIGLIDLYEVDGRPYLEVRTWARHQQIRAKKPKYPAKPSTGNQTLSPDIRCDQMPEDAALIQSNPNPIRIQSNPEEDGVVALMDARGGQINSTDVEVVKDLERSFGARNVVAAIRYCNAHKKTPFLSLAYIQTVLGNGYYAQPEAPKDEKPAEPKRVILGDKTYERVDGKLVEVGQ